jgi:long-chain fatty acid transport protein
MPNQQKHRYGATAAMLLSAATCVGIPSSAAQTTAQFPIQFDFLNPGARSLAMGSAFSGLGDDATAALTNPAGLLQLSRPEVSVEGRFRSLTTRYLERGRISGNIANLGEDVINGAVYAEDEDSGFGASFISFTYPSRRWAVSAYRHELTRVENAFLYRGVFERSTFGGITDDRSRDIPLTGTRAIQIDNYGGSAAFQVNEKLRIGAGVSIFKFDLDASFRRVGLASTDIYGPVDLNFTGGSTAVQTSDDIDLGFNIGLHAMVTPTLRIGAVFRKAPDFNFTQVDTIPSRPTLTRTGVFQVPDTAAVGVAWRATEEITLTTDYVHVGYGGLKEDFINFQAISSGREDQLRIDDGNEFHAGVEWLFAQLRFAPAVRGGFWFDPDHTVAYVSNGSGDQLDVRYQFVLPGGEDLWHYTFGGGLSLSRIFEVNAGADLSKRGAHASASIIVRFP